MVVGYLVVALVVLVSLLGVTTLAIVVDDERVPLNEPIWQAEFALAVLVVVTGLALRSALIG